MKLPTTASLALLVTTIAAHGQMRMHEGQIEGAPFAVASPEQWNGGKAFFHVHGWRPANAPHTADLDLADPFYENLIADGWLIGRTAFQENGVDHDSHTKALRDLKMWIEEKLGPIETLVLEGESTAGTLVLRIAERDADLAEGVIALGPFVNITDPADEMYLTGTPKIPAILMTNTTEIADDVEYAALAADSATPPALRPLLRPGHINVNWVERLAALDSLTSALQSGENPSFANGTRSVPKRETGTKHADGYLANEVTQINPFYGNAFLGFHPDELEAAGINQGHHLSVEAKGQSLSVYYGTSYGDVPEGEWVAFPTADDRILLVRNHESAVETAGLSVGDTIKIRLP